MSLASIFQFATAQQLGPKTLDVIKKFDDNEFSELLYWSSRDQDYQRGYEKTKLLIECAKEKKCDLHVCCKGCIEGIVQSQNWKILNDIKPYIDINEFHDTLDLTYDFETFDKTQVFSYKG